MEYYDNCISLGWFCGTASSMEKYGLRSHSGPFDWYFSDFDSVLKVIETDFSDFMKRENLWFDDSNCRVFYDTKYGFHCSHDVAHNFEEEYPLIYQKYMRRAEQFKEDIKSPTCFIRTVKDESEISFIEKNRNYIYEVLRKENTDNNIIFLLNKNLRNMSDDFLWFRLNIEEYIGKTYQMRYMFSTSRDFEKYCQNILSPEDIKHNIKFDKKHLKMGARMSILLGKAKEGRLFHGA